MADGRERLGAYHLERRLGRGGMAEVFLARAPGGAAVVVKRMLPHLAAEATYVKMFLREARSAARLDHPNVTRLLDVDRDGDDLYLVFSFVDGCTLHELARKAWHHQRALPVALCWRAVADAAIGLHHAHELRDEEGRPVGLVHRDVSPDNLMIDRFGVTHVLDFGIAKPMSETHGSVSGTGELRGKLAFMSPEQAQGFDVDRRADVFALGVTLTWLLTAQKPFTRRTEILSLRALLEEPAPRPSTLNPAVPPALDAIVARALEKEPAARYPTARALSEALRALAPSGPTERAADGRFVDEITALAEPNERTQVVAPPETVPSADVIRLESGEDAAMATGPDDTLEGGQLPSPRAPRRVRLTAAVALAALAAFGVGVGGVVVLLAKRSPRPDAAPADAATPPASLTPTPPPAMVDAPDAGRVDDATGQGVGRDDDAPAVDEPAVEPLPPAARVRGVRVTVVAPSSIAWRSTSGAPLAQRGGVVEVPASAKKLIAVDRVRGSTHEVPIVAGRADFGALPKGTLRVWLPPAGGTVFLGDERAGDAPLPALTLPVGRYRIRVKLAGGSFEDRVVLLGPGVNPAVRFVGKP